MINKITPVFDCRISILCNHIDCIPTCNINNKNRNNFIIITIIKPTEIENLNVLKFN